jgi:hypothetical protein
MHAFRAVLLIGAVLLAFTSGASAVEVDPCLSKEYAEKNCVPTPPRPAPPPAGAGLEF